MTRVLILSLIVIGCTMANAQRKIINITENGQRIMQWKQYLPFIKNDSLLSSFQNNLTTVLQEYPDLVDYNFEFKNGTELRIFKSKVENTYGLINGKIDVIGVNTATLSSPSHTVILYFNDPKELLDKKWNAVYDDQKNKHHGLFKPQLSLQSVRNYELNTKQYSKIKKPVNVGFLIKPEFFVGMFRNNWGLGTRLFLEVNSSKDILGLNRVSVGLETAVIQERYNFTTDIMGLVRFGGDLATLDFGFPIVRDYKLLGNRSFMYGATIIYKQISFSPRLYIGKDSGDLGMTLNYHF